LIHSLSLTDKSKLNVSLLNEIKRIANNPTALEKHSELNDVAQFALE
jgi:hypothetical protein